MFLSHSVNGEWLKWQGHLLSCSPQTRFGQLWSSPSKDHLIIAQVFHPLHWQPYIQTDCVSNSVWILDLCLVTITFCKDELLHWHCRQHGLTSTWWENTFNLGWSPLYRLLSTLIVVTSSKITMSWRLRKEKTRTWTNEKTQSGGNTFWLLTFHWWAPPSLLPAQPTILRPPPPFASCHF